MLPSERTEEHTSQLAVPVPSKHQDFSSHDEVVQEVASARAPFIDVCNVYPLTAGTGGTEF